MLLTHLIKFMQSIEIFLQSFKKIIIIYFSLLLNNVVVAAKKPNAKRNWFYFYAPDSPPLNSRAKVKKSFALLFYARFDSKNILNSVGFTKPASKFCA